jgi:hypothetical protein
VIIETARFSNFICSGNCKSALKSNLKGDPPKLTVTKSFVSIPYKLHVTFLFIYNNRKVFTLFNIHKRYFLMCNSVQCKKNKSILKVLKKSINLCFIYFSLYLLLHLLCLLDQRHVHTYHLYNHIQMYGHHLNGSHTSQ